MGCGMFWNFHKEYPLPVYALTHPEAIQIQTSWRPDFTLTHTPTFCSYLAENLENLEFDFSLFL